MIKVCHPIGETVYFHDHFDAIGRGKLLDLTESEAALRVGDRLLLKPREDLYADHAAALQAQLSAVTQRLAMHQQLYARLCSQTRLPDPAFTRA